VAIAVFGEIARTYLDAAYLASRYKYACVRAASAAVALLPVLDDSVSATHSVLAVVVDLLKATRGAATVPVNTLSNSEIRRTGHARLRA
jgi:hypothetical protein